MKNHLWPSIARIRITYKRGDLQALIQNKITFHYRSLMSISKFGNVQSFALRWVVSSRRHFIKQQSVLEKKVNHITTITQGYQDEMFLDRVPVNLGSLLSLKERAPSAPSSEFADNFIARESRRWFSSRESPGCWSRPLAYAIETWEVLAASSSAKAFAAGYTASRVGKIWW